MIKLKIVDKDEHIYATSNAGEAVSILHTSEYREGDHIYIECERPGAYCVIQLEDTMAPALVYIPGQVLCYHVPGGADRAVLSPMAFTGRRHLVCARLASEGEIRHRRNLAFNPYDQAAEGGYFPHASSNIQGASAMFAARNAVDGVCENCSHGEWPYASWGINRDPKAAWKLTFGREVELDELRVTLRADFPHDSFWTQGTVEFSDGSSEVLHFEKTACAQRFPIAPRKVEWLVFKDLVKADDASPFPALTQFEAWGRNV